MVCMPYMSELIEVSYDRYDDEKNPNTFP